MAVTDLYNAAFMDHVSHPDYKYEMDSPTHEHDGINPSCGDELTLQLRVELYQFYKKVTRLLPKSIIDIISST